MRTVIAEGRLLPVARWGFPRMRFVTDDTTVDVGRLSWFSVFFGRGQKIRLPDGTRWRLRAMTRGRHVCPVIVAETGGKIALSGPGDRNYGIATRDRSFVLSPADGSPRRARTWVLDEHGERVATLTRKPFTITAVPGVPAIPLGAALLAPVLMRFGVLGEAELMPRMRPWG